VRTDAEFVKPEEPHDAMLLVKVARSSRCSTVSMSSDGVALRMPHARARTGLRPALVIESIFAGAARAS
jgi:hypothetical protein